MYLPQLERETWDNRLPQHAETGGVEPGNCLCLTPEVSPRQLSKEAARLVSRDLLHLVRACIGILCWRERFWSQGPSPDAACGIALRQEGLERELT